MKRCRGFTLVELVVTVSMMAVLSAAAVGGLMGLQTWRATSAVQRVHEDITYARATAMLTGRRTLIDFRGGRQFYQIRQEAKPHTGPIDAELIARPIDGAPWIVNLAELGGGVSLIDAGGSGAYTIGFDAGGLPVKAGGAAVTTDTHIRFDHGAEIVVYAATGVSEVVWP